VVDALVLLVLIVLVLGLTVELEVLAVVLIDELLVVV
jgi:hypothetical protein